MTRNRYLPNIFCRIWFSFWNYRLAHKIIKRQNVRQMWSLLIWLFLLSILVCWGIFKAEWKSINQSCLEKYMKMCNTSNICQKFVLNLSWWSKSRGSLDSLLKTVSHKNHSIPLHLKQPKINDDLCLPFCLLILLWVGQKFGLDNFAEEIW